MILPRELFGVLGVVDLLVGWSLGWFVYRSRPRSEQNRALALYLVFVSSHFGLRFGVSFFATDPTYVFALIITGMFFAAGHVISYPWLLSTLDTPLARPLRSKWFWMSWGSAMLLWFTSPLWAPGLHVTALVPSEAVPGAFWTELGPLGRTEPMIPFLISTYGIVVAVTAAFRARSPVVRRQMQAFAAAFVLNDLIYVVNVIVAVPEVFTGHVLDSDWALIRLNFLVAVLLLCLVLAYGVIQTHLFDIDLRIKRGIRRSTVAAVFVAAFFVVSELVAGLLSERIGLIAGVFATGALVFALAPLQSFAERVSDKAMPGVRDNEEYRTVRKRDVYLAALEGALVDGIVNDRERDMLVRLQDQLGLSATEARELERASAV
ncbi:MAG: hypothetical protein KY455_10455 [Euryarchaeota archaeon]|nr:hypothetical protein [Euryarchaeota archaeon]